MKVTITDAGPVLHKGFRYEAGKSYTLDTETGGMFKGLGWATSVPRGENVDLSEPFKCSDATEKDAERFQAEARERAERNARRQRGEQEPDLDVKDGKLGSSSSF
jgi:hypothetical protein